MVIVFCMRISRSFDKIIEAKTYYIYKSFDKINETKT